MKKALIITLLIMSTHYIYGQKNSTNQSLVWYGLYTTFEINKKWYFQNEFQERHYVAPTAQHQLILRKWRLITALHAIPAIRLEYAQ